MKKVNIITIVITACLLSTLKAGAIPIQRGDVPQDSQDGTVDPSRLLKPTTLLQPKFHKSLLQSPNDPTLTQDHTKTGAEHPTASLGTEQGRPNRSSALTKINTFYASLKSPKERDILREKLAVWWEGHKKKHLDLFLQNQKALRTARSKWEEIVPPLTDEQIEILTLGLERDLMDREGLSPQAWSGKMRKMAGARKKRQRSESPQIRLSHSETALQASHCDKQRAKDSLRATHNLPTLFTVSAEDKAKIDARSRQGIRDYASRYLKGRFRRLRDKSVQDLLQKKLAEWWAREACDPSRHQAFLENKRSLAAKEYAWQKGGLAEEDKKVLRLGHQEMMMEKDDLSANVYSYGERIRAKQGSGGERFTATALDKADTDQRNVLQPGYGEVREDMTKNDALSTPEAIPSAKRVSEGHEDMGRQSDNNSTGKDKQDDVSKHVNWTEWVYDSE